MVLRGKPREMKTVPLEEMSARLQKKINSNVIKVQYHAPCSGNTPALPAKTEPLLQTVSNTPVSERTTGTEVRGCGKQFSFMSCY